MDDTMFDAGSRPDDGLLRTTVRNPGELVATLPYLFGFEPRDSLVLVALEGRPTMLGAAVRVDVPPDDDPVAARAVADEAVMFVLRQSPASVVVCAYCASASRAGAVVDAALEALADMDVEVTEALRADGESWWSYLCHDPSCCPPRGTSYADHTSPPVAAAVLAGLQKVASREALAAVVAPDPGARCAPLRRCLDDVRLGESSDPSTERQVLQAYARLCDVGDPQPADQALLLVAAQDVTLRDLLWSQLRRSTAVVAVDVWAAITRAAPERLVAPAASLVAFAAWLAGQSALADHAVQRAVAADPSYSLAGLMADVLTSGVSPEAWESCAAAHDDGVPPPGAPS